MQPPFTQYDLTRAKASGALGIASSPQEHDTFAPFRDFCGIFIRIRMIRNGIIFPMTFACRELHAAKANSRLTINTS